MIRCSRSILCVLLCYALSISAQQPASTTNIQSPIDDSKQPQHVAPPSASLSLEQLETEGDSLRAQKDYLDAIERLPDGAILIVQNCTWTNTKGCWQTFRKARTSESVTIEENWKS